MLPRDATAGTRPSGRLTGPSAGSPPRLPGSVRRTSSLDLTRPDGPMGPLQVAGRARDLRTGVDGQAEVLAGALLSATVQKDGTVSRLRAHPDGPRVSQLRGRKVAAGFRTAIWRELRDHYDGGSPLHLLLDELPVSLIIAGFTYRRSMPAGMPHQGRRVDVCAGWVDDGHAVRGLAVLGAPPTPNTPDAPPLPSDDDPLGWHTLPALPVWGLSRRRRIDVHDRHGDWQVDAMFRDSFVDADGQEKVLHEYAAQARIDPRSGVTTALEATARVLPHPECPLSAASAQRIVGARATRLREVVSMELFGPSSCTHLNDLFRSLADAPPLAGQLATPGRPAAD